MTYGYDNNGNELTAGSSTYAYDLADRLSSATIGGATETYAHAGDGVRTSADRGAGDATAFVVDRNAALPQVAELRDGSGAVTSDVRYGLDLLGLDEPAGVTTYTHHDALGSVTDLTDAAGEPLAWTTYAPFGAVGSAGAAPGAPSVLFGFTGQYLDAATGLYHLRARQYDPATGRFTAVDPVPISTMNPYLSAYVYGSNNPARYTDPSGRCIPVAVEGGAIGLVGGPVGAAGGATAGFVACLALVAGGIIIAQGFLNTPRPSEPVAQPQLDPGTQKAIIELWRSVTPDVHTGLPGGGRPEWCTAHTTICRGAVLTIGAIVTYMIAASGGIDPLEEGGRREPGVSRK